MDILKHIFIIGNDKFFRYNNKNNLDVRASELRANEANNERYMEQFQ